MVDLISSFFVFDLLPIEPLHYLFLMQIILQYPDLHRAYKKRSGFMPPAGMDVVISLPKKVNVLYGRPGSRVPEDEEKLPSTLRHKMRYEVILCRICKISF